MNDLTENLSKALHDIWSNWYIYQRDNSTDENIKRWNYQSMTDYNDLSEEDKEKDRKIVREKLLSIIEENDKLKNQNIRLRDIIKTCMRYLDNQSVIDAWADNIKMDINDSMSDLGMEEIKSFKHY